MKSDLQIPELVIQLTLDASVYDYVTKPEDLDSFGVIVKRIQRKDHRKRVTVVNSTITSSSRNVQGQLEHCRT